MTKLSRIALALPGSRTCVLLGAAVSCLLQSAVASAAPTLTGWANMPAITTAPGPTSGQFAVTDASKAFLPIANAQPVQGISAVLRAPAAQTYHVMPDNGFGQKTNSADALLRVYAIKPEFKVWNGSAVVGKGEVVPARFDGRKNLDAFNVDSFIGLRDPNRKLGFTIQADFEHYDNDPTKPIVDASIRAGRLLTGADFDIESVRRDKNGNLWFGDEFGPYLLKTDKTGKVLRSQIPLPNIKPKSSTASGELVQSPQNPQLSGTANLGASNGFEGMAINQSGDKLYTLLEGTVTGDTPKSLRIDEFSIKSETYTGKNFLYQLDARGTNIGDMTAVNEHQFVVIERNGNTATTPDAPYKRIFLIDTNKVDSSGYVQKAELVDLMNIADPHDLNGDGSTLFTFPYVTIESVLFLDAKTLLVINDNNFPGTGGRNNTAPDTNEFLLIKLDKALNLDDCDNEDRKRDKGHNAD